MATISCYTPRGGCIGNDISLRICMSDHTYDACMRPEARAEEGGWVFVVNTVVLFRELLHLWDIH